MGLQPEPTASEGARQDQNSVGAEARQATLNAVIAVVPRWQYDAFSRWFIPSSDRDGVDAFAGRPLRAPGT